MHGTNIKINDDIIGVVNISSIDMVYMRCLFKIQFVLDMICVRGILL